MGGVSVGVMVGETDHLLFYALSLASPGTLCMVLWEGFITM